MYWIKVRNGKLFSNDKIIVLKFVFGIYVYVVMKRDFDEVKEDKGFNLSN